VRLALLDEIVHAASSGLHRRQLRLSATIVDRAHVHLLRPLEFIGMLTLGDSVQTRMHAGKWRHRALAFKPAG
jgi:hypothetical protein